MVGNGQQGALETAHRKMMSELASRIRDRRVLDAFARTPREVFVPLVPREMVYGDHPLPIGFSQTVSQPYIVALMLQALALKGHEIVLEVGTGSGVPGGAAGTAGGKGSNRGTGAPDLALRCQRKGWSSLGLQERRA